VPSRTNVEVNAAETIKFVLEEVVNLVQVELHVMERVVLLVNCVLMDLVNALNLVEIVVVDRIKFVLLELVEISALRVKLNVEVTAVQAANFVTHQLHLASLALLDSLVLELAVD